MSYCSISHIFDDYLYDKPIKKIGECRYRSRKRILKISYEKRA